MKDKFILISGRSGAGKTELALLYCNQYPETTLLISEEYSEEYILKRGLDSKVMMIGQDQFREIDLSKYKSICIDYVELFDEDKLQYIIKKSSEIGIRIIALTHMRPHSYQVKNIFQSIFASYTYK